MLVQYIRSSTLWSRSASQDSLPSGSTVHVSGCCVSTAEERWSRVGVSRLEVELVGVSRLVGVVGRSQRWRSVDWRRVGG